MSAFLLSVSATATDRDALFTAVRRAMTEALDALEEGGDHSDTLRVMDGLAKADWHVSAPEGER